MNITSTPDHTENKSPMIQSVCWVKSDIPANEFLNAEEMVQICRVDGTLHKLYQALSVWPAPMLAAHKFYQAILHAPDSPFDLYTAEFIATHVAILCGCTYAEAHHGENFKQLAPSREEASSMLEALRECDLSNPIFNQKFLAIATYTQKLTKSPGTMVEDDIHHLRIAGLSEAEILQTNQIASSFAYWTRMINGLGIQLGDETIGLAPETLQKICSRRAVK